MSEHEWIKEFPAAITVCDATGVLLEMNDRAAKTYANDGGYELLGKNMLDCHPEFGARQDGTIAGRAREERLLHREEWHQEADFPIAVVQEWRVCWVR